MGSDVGDDHVGEVDGSACEGVSSVDGGEVAFEVRGGLGDEHAEGVAGVVPEGAEGQPSQSVG